MTPLDDLPPDWLATLDAVVSSPASIAPAARFWGVMPQMIDDGWLVKWEFPLRKAVWTLTPAAAEALGVRLVERLEGEPVWLPSGIPDPPQVAESYPRERRMPDSAWLTVPDPHSTPTSAEARRRNMTRKARRRAERERRKAG